MGSCQFQFSVSVGDASQRHRGPSGLLRHSIPRNDKSHQPSTNTLQPKQGFSLIELSIVLVIIGVILSSIIPLASAHVDVKKIETTREKLVVIQKALNLYATLNKALPCPASKTAAPDSANFGLASDCTAAPVAGVTQIGTNPNYVRVGAIPVRALNLPEAMMFDSWNNRFTYAVTRAATGAALADGIISVTDANNNPVTSPASSAVYVVFSSGKDGKGTHNRRGVATSACATGAKDGENCDGDIIFRDTAINDGDNASLYFDDLVLWRTKPMVEDESGALNGGGSGGGPPSGSGGEYNEDAGMDWSSFRGEFVNRGGGGGAYSRFTYDPENVRRDCRNEPGYNYFCKELLVPDDINAILISGMNCTAHFYNGSKIGHWFHAGQSVLAHPSYVKTNTNKRITISGWCIVQFIE